LYKFLYTGAVDPIMAFNVYHDLIQELRLLAVNRITALDVYGSAKAEASDEHEEPDTEDSHFCKGLGPGSSIP
jgi:hypothetical protein